MGPTLPLLNVKYTIHLRESNLFPQSKSLMLPPPYIVIYPLWFISYAFTWNTFPARPANASSGRMSFIA